MARHFYPGPSPGLDGGRIRAPAPCCARPLFCPLGRVGLASSAGWFGPTLRLGPNRRRVVVGCLPLGRRGQARQSSRRHGYRFRALRPGFGGLLRPAAGPVLHLAATGGRQKRWCDQVPDAVVSSLWPPWPGAFPKQDVDSKALPDGFPRRGSPLDLFRRSPSLGNGPGLLVFPLSYGGGPDGIRGDEGRSRPCGALPDRYTAVPVQTQGWESGRGERCGRRDGFRDLRPPSIRWLGGAHRDGHGVGAAWPSGVGRPGSSRRRPLVFGRMALFTDRSSN